MKRFLSFLLCIVMIAASAALLIQAGVNGAPTAVAGDMNEDGVLSSTDALYLLRHSMNADGFPLVRSGDVDDSGRVNSNDALYLLRHTINPDRFPLFNQEIQTEPATTVAPETAAPEEEGIKWGITGVMVDEMTGVWQIDLYIDSPSDEFWGDAWFGIYDRSVTQDILYEKKGNAGFAAWDYIWADKTVDSGITRFSITNNNSYLLAGVGSSNMWLSSYPNDGYHFKLAGCDNLKVVLFYTDGMGGNGYTMADSIDVSLAEEDNEYVPADVDWGITNVTVNEASGAFKVDLYIDSPSALFWNDAWFGIYDGAITQDLLNIYKGDAGFSAWNYIWPDGNRKDGRTEFSIDQNNTYYQSGVTSRNIWKNRYEMVGNRPILVGHDDLKVVLFYSDGASGNGYKVADMIDLSLASGTTVEQETSKLIKNPGIAGMDFVLEIPSGREPRVLQITDTQMIRFSGIRGGSRYDQVKNTFFVEGDERSKDDYIRTWRYVEEGILLGNPDLIVFTGDNIYGETDDNGSLWTDFCNKMDSYGIPWAVVWGNHDNESQKGVRWQVQMVENSKYGIIKQNNTAANGKGGNSNFNIGIKQDGEIRYVFYMMDTNGARVKSNPGESLLANNPDIGLIKQTDGIDTTQRDWIANSYKSITQAIGKEVPTMWFMHIPPQEARTAWQKAYPNSYNKSPFTPSNNGDQGWATEGVTGGFGFYCTNLGQVMKDTNCTGVFMGHLHNNCASVAWDGIRYTFGIKTGTYDYFDYTGEHLGTILIRIDEETSDFALDYQYTRLPLVDVNGPGHKVS